MSLQGPGLGEQNQAEGFSQQATSGGEPSNHKGVPVCVITPYVCACTEIIIHTSVKDKRIKNTAHTTRGGGGAEEALLILGGAGVVSRGPLQPSVGVSGWVCGWCTEKHSSQR